MPATKTQPIKTPKPAQDVSARQGRAWLLALCVVVLAADAKESQATVLGCEKPNADPQYCHNNEPRQVCDTNGHVVWKDSQTQVSQGELHFLSADGRVPVTKCQK